MAASNGFNNASASLPVAGNPWYQPGVASGLLPSAAGQAFGAVSTLSFSNTATWATPKRKTDETFAPGAGQEVDMPSSSNSAPLRFFQQSSTAFPSNIELTIRSSSISSPSQPVTHASFAQSSIIRGATLPASKSPHSSPFGLSNENSDSTQTIGQMCAARTIPPFSDPQWLQQRVIQKFAEHFAKPVYLPAGTSSIGARPKALESGHSTTLSTSYTLPLSKVQRTVYLPVLLTADGTIKPQVVNFASVLIGHTLRKASVLRAARLECGMYYEESPIDLFYPMPDGVRRAAEEAFSRNFKDATDDARVYLRPDEPCANVVRPVVTKSPLEIEVQEETFRLARSRKQQRSNLLKSSTKSSTNKSIESSYSHGAAEAGRARAERTSEVDTSLNAMLKQHREKKKQKDEPKEEVAVGQQRLGRAKALPGTVPRAYYDSTQKNNSVLAIARQSQHSRLLALPAELRNTIYAMGVMADVPLNLGEVNVTVTPALLQVCHQIRSEALPLYYSMNDFTVTMNDANTAGICHWLDVIGREGGSHLRRIEVRCPGKVGTKSYEDEFEAHHCFAALTSCFEASFVCRDAIEIRSTFYAEYNQYNVYDAQGSIRNFDLWRRQRQTHEFHHSVRHYMCKNGYPPFWDAQPCRLCRGRHQVSSVTLTGGHVLARRSILDERLDVPHHLLPHEHPGDEPPLLYPHMAKVEVYKSCIKRCSTTTAGQAMSQYRFDFSAMPRYELVEFGRIRRLDHNSDASV